MAILDSAKVDLLYKKYFGVTKTDLPANKSPSNESIASPLLVRGDIVWQQASSIPGTAAAVAGIVQSYNSTGRIECTADITTVPVGGVYPTWKTNLIDWIPSEFGATYFIKVYVDNTGASNPSSTGTQIFDSGAGNTGEWNFDYSAGVLNFIGGTIPAPLTSSKKIFVMGYRYIGLKGVNVFGNLIIGNISITGNTITGNSGVTFGGNITANNITANGYVSSGNGVISTSTYSGPYSNGIVVDYVTGNGRISVGPDSGINFYNGGVANILLGSFSSTGNLTVPANVIAGSILSNNILFANGVPYSFGSTYGNANVAAFLANFGANTITTTGNITGNLNGNIYTDTITPYQSTITVFNSTTAITLPIGANSARPSSPQAGQIRYNSEYSSVEFYNGSGWVNVVNTIDGQNFYGDGTNNLFTLTHGSTQTGIIVSINGTLQQPGYAYTVSGDQITFTETPLSTDQIDIRFLAAAVVNATDTSVIDTGNVIVNSTPVTIDTWPATSYRSAKYTISSSNPFDAQLSDLQVVHDGTDSYLNAMNMPTGSNTITYTTSLVLGNVIVQANGSTTGNRLRIQRTYFLL